jgi:RecA-family ATPase
MDKKDKKSFLTLKEVLEAKKSRPKPKYLFSGVKEKSFGLIFGPSKSGKTIFCENLAMSIAYGAKEFLGYKLEGIPKKILFIGLEEFWENRAERNQLQIEVLNESEKELVEKNFLTQNLDFTSKIISDNDWEDLEKMIIDSGAEVVFIDSITRMNPGKLENSADAEKVMQKLRGICHRTDVTLTCIHHTPKMGDSIINMDSIKGSSVFAQESDFAIAVTQTKSKTRYVKNIFFRYAPDDDENVKVFSIDSSTWINHLKDENEIKVITKKDRRRSDDKRDKIMNYFNESPCKIFKTSELVGYVTSIMPIKERQAKTYLKDLVDEGKINNPSKGNYKSTNCINEKLNDE